MGPKLSRKVQSTGFISSPDSSPDTGKHCNRVLRSCKSVTTSDTHKDFEVEELPGKTRSLESVMRDTRDQRLSNGTFAEHTTVRKSIFSQNPQEESREAEEKDALSDDEMTLGEFQKLLKITKESKSTTTQRKRRRDAPSESNIDDSVQSGSIEIATKRRRVQVEAGYIDAVPQPTSLRNRVPKIVTKEERDSDNEDDVTLASWKTEAKRPCPRKNSDDDRSFDTNSEQHTPLSASRDQDMSNVVCQLNTSFEIEISEEESTEKHEGDSWMDRSVITSSRDELVTHENGFEHEHRIQEMVDENSIKEEPAFAVSHENEAKGSNLCAISTMADTDDKGPSLGECVIEVSENSYDFSSPQPKSPKESTDKRLSSSTLDKEFKMLGGVDNEQDNYEECFTRHPAKLPSMRKSLSPIAQKRFLQGSDIARVVKKPRSCTEHPYDQSEFISSPPDENICTQFRSPEMAGKHPNYLNGGHSSNSPIQMNGHVQSSISRKGILRSLSQSNQHTNYINEDYSFSSPTKGNYPVQCPRSRKNILLSLNQSNHFKSQAKRKCPKNLNSTKRFERTDSSYIADRLKCSSSGNVISEKPYKNSPAIKGILKDRYTCSTACVCETCSSIRERAKKAASFSRRQMLDTRNIVTTLMNEVKSMRGILQATLDSRTCATSLGPTTETILDAVHDSTNVEETAKKWLTMMSKDCNRFCEIMRNPLPKLKDHKKKMRFADEAGKELCDVTYFDPPEENKEAENSSLPINDEGQNFDFAIKDDRNNSYFPNSGYEPDPE